ncbi:glycoside hydrolase family 15 protein [Paraliomyxa miuraensis]|uniref:glycoside hydrolase family 15 protein n=1 Tax=Paraliomyxa miuraensis TaxID=376150 RepID=UPI00224D1934|nr:glycoside hydrolase family 15 protein [Paraliomyxa miuraensis]MCX4240239.1 glycoside hydrolase family 15 protein [Paraliomyxa miuraensis]
MSDLDDNYHMGLIGNGRTGALIDRQGSMKFACLPDFDSGAVFCGLLDPDRGGQMNVSMIRGRATAQDYVRHTNIIRTRFEGRDGVFEMFDFMPRYRIDGGHDWPYTPPDIVRVLRPVSGTPRVKVGFDPRLEFGRFGTDVRVVHDGLLKCTTRGRDGRREIYESIYLYTNADARRVREGKVLVLDRTMHLLLSYNDKLQEPDSDRVRLMLAQTEAYWLGWSSRTTVPPRYRESVLRSALALKLMQYGRTGALIAAPTTSLPESIGESRNWDYRFCWLRDASMTVSVLRRIGHPDMAHHFVQWVLDATPSKDDPLQIMYGLRGERELTERELPHLAGYQGSSPVRVGNAAYKQRQHDIYGAVLDVFWQSLDHFATRLDVIEDMWTRVRSVFRTVERIWSQPDRGIWEFRGAKRHFVFSKVLCWVAADRAVRIAERLGRHRWADQHRHVAEEIRQDVLSRGWSNELGAFAQSYGSDEPDASNLLMVDYGFLPPDDPRYVATVERAWELLGRGEGLLMRYRSADDFGEPSSAFTICCFWGVKALVHIGQIDRARAAFERLLVDCNHMGLLSEDLHITSRRQLGNFPQAYSHLALIDTALALADATGWDDVPALLERVAY